MPGEGIAQHGCKQNKWLRLSIVGFTVLCGILSIGCQHYSDSQKRADYLAIQWNLTRGNLSEADLLVARALHQMKGKDDEANWSVRVLGARIEILQGRSLEALNLLNGDLPQSIAGGDLEIQQAMLRAMAYARLGRPEVAAQELRRARAVADLTHSRLEAELFSIRGSVVLQNGDAGAAEALFQRGLELARQGNDRFLQSAILLNLSFAALNRERYDEARDWSSASSVIAQSIDARLILEKALGNAGWAYYKLGETERALAAFQQAEVMAAKCGAKMDRIRRLDNAGLAQYQLHKWTEAETYYQRALDLAQSIQSPDDILDTETNLAFLLLERGNIQGAKKICDDALKIAASMNDKSDLDEPLFLRALLELKIGDRAKAEETLATLETSATDYPSLRWKVEDELARLRAKDGKLAEADRWFQKSVETFEAQRSTLQYEDSKLPFFTNASQVYGDYAEYLVNYGRSDEALKLIDLGRARTLAEGLGLAPKDSRSLFHDDLNPRDIARKLNGTILSYWLGPNESYLWAITPSQARLFRLPNETEITSRIRSYQKRISNSNDVLADNDESGQSLWDLLVRPAQPMIPKNSKVFIVPDGSLNLLNFETLLAPEPIVHYWIEDAVVVSANSIRMLAAFAAHPRTKTSSGLLLIGDPISPGGAFDELPNASKEAAQIEKHFLPEKRLILTREHALPAAYAASHPEQYSYIHFVAHGTASLLSPLESAVILSRTPGDPGTFKLYARDIMRHPLRSELVTISACYGSGARAYAGEGLVGLSWAFLRAGSHYVAGALWEVSDSSTPQMMDEMYTRLERGGTPDVALREAKLLMVHSSGIFRKPFYWGSFQMYAGS